MSRVTDLQVNNGSPQLPTTDQAKSSKTEPASSSEDAPGLSDSTIESGAARFENRMSPSQLINSATHLRFNLSRKFDEHDCKNKEKKLTNDENVNEKLGQSARHSRQFPLRVWAGATCLQALKEGLLKYAAEMGLSAEGQEKFAEKHLKNFIAQTTAKGLENLLEKPGDLTLLKSDDSPLKAKVVGNDLYLTLSANARLNLPETASPAKSSLQTGESVANANLNHTRNLPPETVRTNSNSNLNFYNANLQRAEIQAKLPAAIIASPEFNSLKVVIQKKIENILQQLGLGGEASSAVRDARATPTGKLPFALQNHEAALPEGGDKALFATTFGMALDAAQESRTLHGDGVLQEFANYGGEQRETGGSAQNALAIFFQNGTEAGFATLLESARADFSKTNLDGIAQLQTQLGPDATSDLVVGVVTMSVMTREVVEQLTHVSQDSALGLSDNALAALQKAHNSLRDHLTSTDLIGAVGDLKNTPLEIDGQQYNFLPEVSEALNSLREARSRILSETMYAASDAGGVDSQQRFVRETEVLFNITQRIENLLKIA